MLNELPFSLYNALHLEALEHNQFLIDDMEEMYYENQLELQEEQEPEQLMHERETCNACGGSGVI